MILYLLGSHPQLGLAELEACFHKPAVKTQAHLAYQNAISIDTIQKKAPKLGSIPKIGQLIIDNIALDTPAISSLADQLSKYSTGKITIGLSFELTGTNLDSSKKYLKLRSDFSNLLRQELKKRGRSLRLIYPTKPGQTQLSAASVRLNHLAINNPKKMELIVAKAINPDAPPNNLSITKTIFVQDIDSYTARDRHRPYRDARNGMLPPKLAQTMLNLALSASPHSNLAKLNVLDPFCGTGVVLMEAALNGANVYGSDINERMVKNTIGNLNWLAKTYHQPINYQIETGDATSHHWQLLGDSSINLVVSEMYLGEPVRDNTPLDKITASQQTCQNILVKSLQNIDQQLPPDAAICLAIPFWHQPNNNSASSDIHLDLTNITDKTNLLEQPNSRLCYRHPGQYVGRELLIFAKK